MTNSVSIFSHVYLGMLGVTIRFDSYHDAEEHLCRVTEVRPRKKMKQRQRQRTAVSIKIIVYYYSKNGIIYGSRGTYSPNHR
jgi:hypothetical protein